MIRITVALIVVLLSGLLVLFFVQPDHTSEVIPLAPVVDTYSNVHPEDYVGPESCAQCHAEHFADWKTHPHSRMNLDAADDTVLGNFSAERVAYGNGSALFERVNDQFLMSIYEKDQLTRQYRVTRVVGSRVTQMYIGLQTIGPEEPSHNAYHIEGKLPFGYWMTHDLWTPVTYFDSAYDPEPVDSAQQMHLLGKSQKVTKWETNCLYCHNTYAYQYRVSFGLLTGFMPEDFQFPDGAKSIEQWGSLTPDKLVTLGISCESCHFGGREHVNNGQKTRYYPSSPSLKVRNLATPDSTNPHGDTINSICSQCHCAKVQQYPNGAATWNSREALDMQSGACQQAIKCTDCHNPHRSSDNGGLASEDQNVETCLQCHQSFKASAALTQHTRHDPGSVSCLDCHMPRIVQGLNQVVRTHNICSPTDQRMLQHAGPNACNLCHLDRSIKWTVTELNKGWDAGISIQGTWSSQYGASFDRPVGNMWLKNEQPVIRLIASDACARSGRAFSEFPQLLNLLREPYAVNRMFGMFAIEQLLGRRLSEIEYSPLANQLERDQMVDDLQEILLNAAPE